MLVYKHQVILQWSLFSKRCKQAKQMSKLGRDLRWSCHASDSTQDQPAVIILGFHVTLHLKADLKYSPTPRDVTACTTRVLARRNNPSQSETSKSLQKFFCLTASTLDAATQWKVPCHQNANCRMKLMIRSGTLRRVYAFNIPNHN